MAISKGAAAAAKSRIFPALVVASRIVRGFMQQGSRILQVAHSVAAS